MIRNDETSTIKPPSPARLPRETTFDMSGLEQVRAMQDGKLGIAPMIFPSERDGRATQSGQSSLHQPE